jgi:predicted metalloprotease
VRRIFPLLVAGALAAGGRAQSALRHREGEGALRDRLDRGRRLELQAECFAGVAVKAMRAEMPPWPRYRDLYIGTIPKQSALDHGRVATQLRWFKRGYDSGSPRSCNTWSASKRNVT